MKRMFIIVSVVGLFILGSSQALAAGKEGKGKSSGGTMAVEKTKGKPSVEAPAEKTGKPADAQKGFDEKVKVEKEAGQTKPKPEKKTEDVNSDATEKGKGEPEAVKEKAEGKKEKAAPTTDDTDKGKGKEKSKDASEAKQAKAKETDKDSGKGKSEDKGKADKGKSIEKGKADDGKSKGLGKAQQAAAIKDQMIHDTQTHLERQARLQRMLEVAKGKNDEKAIGRIQKLMEKEGQLYQKKRGRMSERGVTAEERAIDTNKKN